MKDASHRHSAECDRFVRHVSVLSVQVPQQSPRLQNCESLEGERVSLDRANTAMEQKSGKAHWLTRRDLRQTRYTVGSSPYRHPSSARSSEIGRSETKPLAVRRSEFSSRHLTWAPRPV